MFYRAATAALVEKQSREMLELINEKRSEYMMAESLYLDEGDGYTEDVLLPYPSQAPIPAPPALSKFEVYNDPVEFADIDQIAISVRKVPNLSSCDCSSILKLTDLQYIYDRLCGLVVRGPGFDSRALQKKSSGSETGFTQPHEYN
jgi:hypothetical protein